jgi:5-methylcytosine-specific restriction enzyme A
MDDFVRVSVIGDEMALADLTRGAVETALGEAETIGREAFLAKYKFGPARSYFLEWNGRLYDSKAIAGAAHGYLPGRGVLTSSEFSGGEASVAARLRQLGFVLAQQSSRHPAWSRDELILALDLYVRFNGNPPGKASLEIMKLSELLNRIANDPKGVTTSFRNPNGVYMKMMNFRRFDPIYQAQGKKGLTRGNGLEEVVWNDFASNPIRLTETAAAIKANVESLYSDIDETNEIEEAEEGRILTRAHLVRERSRKLAEAKKAASFRTMKRLCCEACGFDFKTMYGERGEGFIEVHHTVPVHQLVAGAVTKIADLHLLCANCHRMIHARRPWLTLEELKACISAQPYVSLGFTQSSQHRETQTESQ